MAKAHNKVNAEEISMEQIEKVQLSEEQLGCLADQEDHDTGVLESLRKYPWASAWCLYASLCTVLVGFDLQAGGSVIGIPQFRKDFGYAYGDGDDYVLPAEWQSAFNGAPIASAVIAALFSAQLADIFGRKRVLMGSLAISYIAVAVEYIATTNPIFFIGKFLNGFMIGTVGTVMVSYIGEISPLALRGIFTCCVGVAYGVGPLVAFLIINYTGDVDTPWAYRTVFCCQFGFAGLVTIFVPFLPESPWWLVGKRRHKNARESLTRLGYTADESQRRLALIELTLKRVRNETEGVTFIECFRKSNLRRTIISVMPIVIQGLSGIGFVAGYFTYYLQLAGYSTSVSYRLQIAQPVLSIVGNLMAAAIIEKVGRRDLTLWGLAILTVFLLITGGLGVGDTQPMIKGTVAFILLYSWWYNVSIGSTAFPILSEVSTARLRVKTIAIGYSLQSAVNLMWQLVIPFMFNPDKANLGAKIAFIFGGMSLLSLIYIWFYQPETGGRSYQELDEMFAKNVPARKFKGYQTDVQMHNSAQSG